MSFVINNLMNSDLIIMNQRPSDLWCRLSSPFYRITTKTYFVPCCTLGALHLEYSYFVSPNVTINHYYLGRSIDFYCYSLKWIAVYLASLRQSQHFGIDGFMATKNSEVDHS